MSFGIKAEQITYISFVKS